MTTLHWILIYIAAVNLLGFFIMGIDKAKARNHAWRISEATLFFVAIIGGSFGSTLGMFVFRHKTRHWYFRYGLPAIFFLELGLVLFIICSPKFNISIM